MILQATTITLPAHWAPYLVNGDASCFETHEELEAAEKHLAREIGPAGRVVSCEEGTTRFTPVFHLYGGDTAGGDVAVYVVHTYKAAGRRAA